MINYYENLTSASRFYYVKYNYLYVDVPWTVSEDVIKITQPTDKKNFYINDKCLVASAEQSFLQMIYDKKLEAGRYQTITPCFRDESIVDDLHKMYFMKLELIDTLTPNKEGLDRMLTSCLDLFKTFNSNCKIIETENGCFDIVTENNIELGSYGMRHHDLVGSWVYGTGIAEPRLSNSI